MGKQRGRNKPTRSRSAASLKHVRPPASRHPRAIKAPSNPQVSADLLNALRRSAKHAVVGQTTRGTITAWNLGAERIYGFRADEIIGRSIRSLAGPERQHEANALLNVVARGEAVKCLNTERIRKDGKRIQLSLTIAPVINSKGAVIGASEVTHTASKSRGSSQSATRDALQASERRFALFMQHVPGLAFIKDAHGRVVFINENHRRAMGWRDADWTGKTVSQLFPPRIASVMEEHDRKVLRTRRPTQELEVIPQGDQEHTYVVSKFPIVDPSSEEVLLGGVCIDVTERIQAETDLRLQKSVLESLVEACRDGVLLVSENGKWLSLNRRFVEMWGIPDAIVKSGSDEQALAFVHDLLVDPAAFRQRIRELYDKPLDLAHDRILLRDGRVFERDSAPVLGPDGRRYGRVWFFHDATEEESQNERLRTLVWQITRSEERERRRIATILHDHVGQTMTTMKLMLRDWVDASATRGDPRGPDLLRLLEDVIVATRTLTVELSPPILYECGLFPALRWLGKTMLVPAGIRFNCRITAQETVGGESDPVLFHAVRELMLNIIKHAHADQVTLQATDTERALQIQVEDDGAGFASSTSGRTGRGDQFGLFSICERMRQLGGSFVLDSAVGKGTRATLRVPRPR